MYAQPSQTRIATNKAALENRNLSFKELGNGIVSFTLPSEGDGDAQKIRTLLDLKTNSVLQVDAFDYHGRMLSSASYGYALNDGIPALRHSVEREYGDLNGNWTVLHQTIINRSNIKAEFY